VLLAGLGAIPAAWLFDRYGPGVTWGVMGGTMTVLVLLGALIFRGGTGTLSLSATEPTHRM
jgi:hypothetical protein